MQEVGARRVHCSFSVVTPPRTVIWRLRHQHTTLVWHHSQARLKESAPTRTHARTRTHTVSCESYDARRDLFILYSRLWRLREHSITGITFHYSLTAPSPRSWVLNYAVTRQKDKEAHTQITTLTSKNFSLPFCNHFVS